MDNLDYTVDQVLELLDRYYEEAKPSTHWSVLPNPLWCEKMVEMRSYRKVAKVFNTHVNSVRQKLCRNVRNVEWFFKGAEPQMFKLPPRLMHTLFKHDILTEERLKEVFEQPNGLDYLEGIGELSKQVIGDFLEH